MNEPASPTPLEAQRRRRIAAGVMLGVAAFALLGRHLPFSWRDNLLLLLGPGFIIWAVLARTAGLLIPGGILTGLGAGFLLRARYGEGAFLLALAGGFLLVGALMWLIFRKRQVWTVFPAGGLTLAGLSVLAGPDFRRWLREAEPYWPYAVIAVALYLLLVKPRAKSD